jgi:RNase P subunit RPR2|tara:strand:+ start:210 stop:542 length:333 start_codon:yes stop_codon:yes gene_type:complete
MYKKLVSDEEHRRMLKKAGLPESIVDAYPPSREKLEEMYPHLKMSEDEKEVHRIVNNTKYDNCPKCNGDLIEAEFGFTSEAFKSDESVSGVICEEECGWEYVYPTTELEI